MNIYQSPLRKPALLVRWLTQPQYAFRPTQLVRRMSLTLHPPASPQGTVTLPWGLDIDYDQRDHIGHTILTNGLYELLVCEVLWRLCEPGESALDVGANIGQMTSLLAARCGKNGCVHSFEPHPLLHSRLETHARRWALRGDVAPIVCHQLALSDADGEGALSVPPEFAVNMGTARVTGEQDPGAHALPTCLARLAGVLPPDVRIGVMKLDVEGHELRVLRGAEPLLREHRVRDIVFEDFGGGEGTIARHLGMFGYATFAVRQTLTGPRLTGSDTRETATSSAGDPPTSVATLDPHRLAARMRGRGWRCLRGRPHKMDGLSSTVRARLAVLMSNSDTWSRSHWIHIPTPGDHYSPRTGSAVMTVVYELTRQHDAAGGATTIVVSEGTAVGYPAYEVGVLAEVPFAGLPGRARKILDVALGRVGARRRNVELAYAPALAAIPAGFQGAVFVHNAPGVVELLRRERPGAQIFLYVHNTLFDTYSPREVRRVVQAADSIVCVSDFIRNYIEGRLGCNDSRLQVVLNGVDTQLFAPPEAYAARRRPLILFLGRVIPAKGPHLLLQAALELQATGYDFLVRIVGSSGFSAQDPLSSYEVHLRRLSVSLGDRIEFVPFTTRDAVVGLYQAADIFCAPSEFGDPCPLNVLEAMACGLPSVLSSRGGMPEEGADAVLYFNPPDHHELASQLARILDSPTLAEQLSVAARARAQTLSWQQAYANLVRCLDSKPEQSHA